MGIVYLGRVEGAAGFAKPVVIKTVLASSASDSNSEALFAREARIVSNLQHPAIVAVIDFGKVDSTHVMVLEYVHGYHLGQWSRFVNSARGKMPVQHAVHVMLAVLDALSFAHQLARPDGTPLGIVHRDISPANVLIDAQGHVKLSDFGIARTADDEYKTQQGLFRGTLAYAPPEAFEGAPATPKLDQYSAAVVLYQLLAGANPFRGDETSGTVGRVLSLVPPLLSTLRDDVPPSIDLAIARALSKDSAQRFASTAEFASALRAGGPWSEREAAESFAAQIRQDFNGTQMASLLDLEPLAVRDESWREEADGRGPAVAPTPSPPRTFAASTLPPTQPSAPLPQRQQPLPESPGRSMEPRGAKGLGKITLVATAAAAGTAALVVVLLRPNTESAPKVLVIEKQDVAATPEAQASQAAPPSTAEPSASGLVAASATPTAPALGGSAARRAAVPADRGALLARAFQRQEPSIQGCFQRNASGGEAPSGMSVRFQIDATGRVQRAQVTPSSIAATPLGSCIAALAQATNFGPQPEPLTFAIPISAHVVRH
jgi:serine/threonine protein kinase